MIKWNVTFGEFSEADIQALAIRMGHDGGEGYIQFVQDKVFAQIAETLSIAEKERVTAEALLQIEDAKKQVEAVVASKIVVELVETPAE